MIRETLLPRLTQRDLWEGGWDRAFNLLREKRWNRDASSEK